MTDPYEVLGVDPRAPQEEVQAAFEELLAARRASHKGASDVHAAFSLIGDPTLRKAFDMIQLGRATNEKLAAAKSAVVESLPEVRWSEVRQQAAQVALKTTVLVSGVTARAADATAQVSRRVQALAASKIDVPASTSEPTETLGSDD